MTAVAENPRAVVGGNNPPAPITAFDAVVGNLDDLYDEAILWLEGEAITTQDQADALNTLLSAVTDAAKAVEEQRVIEKTPHDEAIDEIQTRFNVYLAGFFTKNKASGKATLARDAIKKILAPWLAELDRQQKEAARAAREEADRKQREAIEAMRQRESANLAERAAAEKLIVEAKRAEADAKKAEGAKAHAKGEGRAIGLRTVRRPEMVDFKEAAAWVWGERKDDLRAFVQDLAEKAVRAGAVSVRGFNIVEEKVL